MSIFNHPISSHITMSKHKKQKAEDLRCIFSDLVTTYKGVGLKPCTTDELKWWNANGPKAAERLMLFQAYFLELANYSLESHSLCQKHYNQIVSSNQFYDYLSYQENQLDTDLTSSVQENQSEIDMDTPSYADLTVELDRVKRILESAQQENLELCSKIERLWNDLDEQARETERLKEELHQAYEEAKAFRRLYNDQYEKNKILTERWNSRLSNQQKRIDIVIEIAKAEHEALLNDIVQNSQVTDSSRQEKLFKIVVAVDSIYRARHGKYVSEIQLAASAIEYSIARSKMVIDIDNHITSSESYHQFQKWLEELSKHEEPLPEGLLFLAFDNEQREQRNYLDRGSSQYEEIFNVDPKMQKVIDEELYAYISEKKSCPVCNLRNIENRKRLCSECRTQLPTLTEIQKGKTVEIEDNMSDYLTNPLTFKHYRIDDEQSATHIPKISLTQRIADPGVNVPDIYIPDPININPNLVANVEKILQHIEVISGIRDGSRKWVAVTCDGVPYHYAVKLKEKFPWLVLILRQLHEEINMLCAYVELNWGIDLKRFAIYQGYRTENQLAYFKKCADYHKSWDSICKQQDSLYLIKYEQAINNYRKAVRTNNPFLRRAARRTFSSIWPARRHPIYQLIEVANEVQLMQLHSEIHEIVEKNCVVSRSGIYEQHQWLDAIIEELRNNLFQVIGYNDYQPSGPRSQPESTMECQQFRTFLRNSEFVNSTILKPFQSLDENCELDENLKNFTQLAQNARQKFIIETFINKYDSFLLRPIPITRKEARAQVAEENMTIPEILVKIETLLERLSEKVQKKYSRLKSKKKGELLEILQEIKSLLSLDNEVDSKDTENTEQIQQE
ncbi:hypothetical protein C2G38_2175981 [Gigaspora rosea]|uniref:Uncharacterized protein n=1 Tax=Gigaspora rosea TaxID=44941 RepID=A0A397VK09_9GLOM|nr:hypothetical protein C2G38_2175981 [Gigaspora rosea]